MSGLYDLHTHTLMSDGELLPIELVRRLAVLGYEVVAIADHVDCTNITQVIDAATCLKSSAARYGVRLLAGVEITHVPPEEIAGLAERARDEGADVVVVHGETTVEPVAAGTNHAACASKDVDVLAHPGFITPEDARLASRNGVALEITSRGGHNRTNGYVAGIAREAGCMLVVNSDAHAPSDLLTAEEKMAVARGAGLTEEESGRSASLNILSDLLGI
ncbi:histidinol phosphate phosphatase domain-containing protein [Methanofollis fontis]|uniref:PHP domain-containing protein n=1 Tax=Methanofollis fontis TaxID=2052832 RepID=A0A483CKR5_9EURY|nr:histidinol phosphate phosphatase domain-containing protein [Methanofollis fontis]TAJ43329.1 PHP domain-containing protein [Methanofollis fontis]